MDEKNFNLTQTGQQVQDILNSAKSTDQVLTEIQEAMENLPDGQAVSAQVALNTAAIQELDANKASKTEVENDYAKKTECVFDISAYHATGNPPVLETYADLTAALGTDGANIPEALRKGGMSVKFVQSSDNKYVQYRLMSNSFNTTVGNWQGVDDEPIAGSDNLVKSSGLANLNIASEALKIDYFIIKNAMVNSSGIIGTDGTYNLACYRVEAGKKIESIKITEGNIIYAFFTSTPAIGSVSYNNSRTMVTNTEVTNIQIPANCKWVVIRTKTTYTIEFSPKSFALQELNDKITEETAARISLGGELDKTNNSLKYSTELGLSDGYVYSDGTISPPSANAEKRTRRMFGVGRCRGSITFSSSHNIWIAMGEYDSNQNFIRRQTAGANTTSVSFDFICEPNTAYIIFSFRTFNQEYTLDFNCSPKVQIDETLSIYGRAAEAKQTGNEISGIKNYLYNLSLADVYPSQTAVPDIDTSNETLTIYKGSGICTPNGNIEFGSNDIVIDLTQVAGTSYKKLVFDYENNIFSLVRVREYPEHSVAVAVIVYNNHTLYNITINCDYTVNGKLFGLDTFAPSYNVRSVAHKGFAASAPENTLPAFKLAKKKGFDWVECDVQLTSDNVPVILHDRSINRTARNADGTELSSTVYIDDITYAQALEYDFGIWKSEAYAGTKIPTLAQLMALARAIGLHIVLELEPDTITLDKIDSVINVVRQSGMIDAVEWNCSRFDRVEYIAEHYPTYNLSYTVNEITETAIARVISLKTGKNKVVFYADTHYTFPDISDVIAADISMGVWPIYSANDVLNVNPYVTTFCTEGTNAGKVLYDANI